MKTKRALNSLLLLLLLLLVLPFEGYDQMGENVNWDEVHVQQLEGHPPGTFAIVEGCGKENVKEVEDSRETEDHKLIFHVVNILQSWIYKS